MKLLLFGLVLFVFYLKIKFAKSHGRLLVPPARSSAWREDPNRFPTFYNDNQMFCGGIAIQWLHNCI